MSCKCATYGSMKRPGLSRKPDSALSRHPSPGVETYHGTSLPPGSLWEPRLPARPPFRGPGQFGLLAPVVYLAGPSRDTAGGLLPHPFTHHLCRMGTPLSGHRLVYSLLHLTWRRACAAPPLGFLARAAFPGAKNAPSRVRTLLCEPPERQDHSDGSDGPDLPRYYTAGVRSPASGAGPGGSRPRGGEARSW